MQDYNPLIIAYIAVEAKNTAGMQIAIASFSRFLSSGNAVAHRLVFLKNRRRLNRFYLPLLRVINKHTGRDNLQMIKGCGVNSLFMHSLTAFSAISQVVNYVSI
ncbi:hypothetical protein [Pantoea dispersa]|uniref:hypothetical protein n=1 Tax=Pantoea dispersa TaxID=59814 RepID=UPI001331479A|nr:hypothetical protein [Pantoea dispersa]